MLGLLIRWSFLICLTNVDSLSIVRTGRPSFRAALHRENPNAYRSKGEIINRETAIFSIDSNALLSETLGFSSIASCFF